MLFSLQLTVLVAFQHLMLGYLFSYTKRLKLYKYSQHNVVGSILIQRILYVACVLMKHSAHFVGTMLHTY
jgi:hypothetical protein